MDAPLIMRFTPAQRAVVVGAIATGIIWYTRPSCFFRTDNGRPRVASWAARRDQLHYATPMPWYAAVVVLAVAVDLFV